MKGFFFNSTTTTSPSFPSSSFHPHSSLFDYYDDPAVMDGVPLLSHHHGPLSCSETTTCDHNNHSNEDEQVKDDFEFDFSEQLNMMMRPSLSSADELFDGGKIRPLMMKAKQPDIENRQTRSEDEQQYRFESPGCNNRWNPNDDRTGFQNRGRGEARAGTNQNASTSNKSGGSSARKGSKSRSLSLLRVSEFALFQRQHQQLSSSNSSSSSASCSRKLRLKDLFLFRSASEGHYKNSESFAKRWSFPSLTMSSRSGSGSESKRKGGVQASAHGMHYTSKRAVSLEMKKKTSLPFKHNNGLLACLGCSPILPQVSYTFPTSTLS